MLWRPTRKDRTQPGGHAGEPATQLPGAEAPDGDRLSRQVLKRRVSSGAFFAGSWGLVNLFVGFFGNVALARMLQPRDFGIIAVGATLTMFATSLSDGGLGAGLIRRDESPTRAELRTAFGLQLSLTCLLAGGAAAVAASFGSDGLVVAAMMIALPVAAFQSPARVVLTRAIRVREMATAEAVGVLVYYGWSVAWVVAGAGVWALATGVLVRALVVTTGVVAVSRLGLVMPSLRGVRELRSVIVFGLRFQGVSLAGIAREQGLNTGVAMIGGVATLGLFSLARRLLELPVLMFEPLHRVSFPFMSHVLAAREDPAGLINRGVAISAAASGLVLAGTAAASYELVPALFGEQWRAAGTIVPWICAALVVAGPVSVVGVGYLYARGEPGIVLRAILLHTIALYAVAFPLLPVVGPAAIGLGSLAGAVVDTLVMSHAISKRTTARPLRILAPLVAIAACAGAAGVAVSDAAGTGLLSAIAGGVGAGIVYIALLAVIRPAVLRDTFRLTAEAVRSSLSREGKLAATVPEPA